MGSAMRKPRIQPGRGSARDDSMMEGRTMVMAPTRRIGSPERARPGPSCTDRRRPSEDCARAWPAVTICFFTQSSRRRSARSARRWSPAPPSSPRAALANWSSRWGWRDSASVSPRCRRAATTSVRQSTSTVNRLPSSSSSRPRLMGAGHVRRGHRYEMAGPVRPSSAANCPAATMAAATRDGPSRFTSTAVSRGESKSPRRRSGSRCRTPTGAAGRQNRAETVVGHVPATAETRDTISASNRSRSAHGADRTVVLEDLLGGPLERSAVVPGG